MYDEETGLYYLRSRYYNPEWGRFISADALLGKTGALFSHNLFAYCRNNPITRIDYNGFADWNSSTAIDSITTITDTENRTGLFMWMVIEKEMTFVPYEFIEGFYDDPNKNFLDKLIVNIADLEEIDIISSLLDPIGYIKGVPISMAEKYVIKRMVTRKAKTFVKRIIWWKKAMDIYNFLCDAACDAIFYASYNEACQEAEENKTGIVIIKGNYKVFSFISSTTPFQECHERTNYIANYLNR